MFEYFCPFSLHVIIEIPNLFLNYSFVVTYGQLYARRYGY